ncbi:MAG: DUF1456 family protein [Bdellovibrionaceae bacterium]|nr:DUF1456 family protein [Pseudobdellovibrionaceae bacterium]
MTTLFQIRIEAKLLTNDVLRSLRNLLDIRDQKVLEISEITTPKEKTSANLEQIVAYLKKEDEPGFVFCPDSFLESFLDGLIIYKRGPKTTPASPTTNTRWKLSNNQILKKIRVAFELKEEDVLELIQQPGFSLSKAELNALFRSPDHRNYRECGDQVLRYFLKGLNQKFKANPTPQVKLSNEKNKPNDKNHLTTYKDKEFKKPKLRVFKDD